MGLTLDQLRGQKVLAETLRQDCVKSVLTDSQLVLYHANGTITTIPVIIEGGAHWALMPLIKVKNTMKTYYMNKETGELLSRRQAYQQFSEEYDGGDDTNGIDITEYYTIVRL